MRRSSVTKFALLSAFVLAVSAVVVRAFNPRPDPPGFGLIGVTPDQTARLNIVNIGCVAPNAVSPGPCRAQVDLIFTDAAGNVVSRGSRMVDAGQAASFDVNGASLRMEGDGSVRRAEVRGSAHVVSVTLDRGSFDGGRQAFAVLLPSVEVFDNVGPDMGKSHAVLIANHNPTLLRDEE